MSKIVLNNRQLKKYISSDLIGKGSQASIFKFDEKKVLKYYSDLLKNFKDINRLMTIKNEFEHFCIPNDEIYLKKFNKKEEQVGYTMSYIQGAELNKSFDSASFEKFLNAILQLEYELIEVSKYKVLLNDVYNRNIIYFENINEGSICFIDPDLWKIYDYYSSSEVLKLNTSRICITLYNEVIEFLDCNSFIIKNDQLMKKICSISNSIYSIDSLCDILCEIKYQIEKYAKEKTQTLGELQKLLKQNR